MSSINLLFKQFNNTKIVKEGEQNFNIQKLISCNYDIETEELIIDNCVIQIERDLFQKLSSFQHLIHLGLNMCGIKKLKNFPQLPLLKRLSLEYNNIKNEEIVNLEYYQQRLVSLSLIENKLILNSDVFIKEILKFTQLKQLSLAGNTRNIKEVDYLILREKLFSLMQQLMYFDAIPKDDQLYLCEYYKNQTEQEAYLGRVEYPGFERKQDFCDQ